MSLPKHLRPDVRKAARPDIKQSAAAVRDNLTPAERMALRVTKGVGTPYFFLGVICWTVLWLGWNVVGPKGYRFDPLPSCVLWLLMSNFIQLSLMPMLLMAQNIQSRLSESSADVHYHNTETQRHDMDALHQHLEHQSTLLAEIIDKVDSL